MIDKESGLPSLADQSSNSTTTAYKLCDLGHVPCSLGTSIHSASGFQLGVLFAMLLTPVSQFSICYMSCLTHEPDKNITESNCRLIARGNMDVNLMA